MMRGLLLHVALILAPFMGVMMLASLAGHVLQSRPAFVPDKIKPDFSKLSSRRASSACSGRKAG